MTEPVDPIVVPVDIYGRKVAVKQLTDGQLMLLGRDATLLQKPDLTGAKRLSLTNRIMDILEAAFVAEADWEYVMDLLAKGRFSTVQAIEKIFEAFSAVAEDEAPKKPVVRRGRRAQ